MKKAKAAVKTLRTERELARQSLEGLQRLKAVLPMVDAQRMAIDGAIETIRFAWRNHKLETKIGDTITLSEYADSIVRTALPPMRWRKINTGKVYKTTPAPK